jgi:hypothetical protein
MSNAFVWGSAKGGYELARGPLILTVTQQSNGRWAWGMLARGISDALVVLADGEEFAADSAMDKAEEALKTCVWAFRYALEERKQAGTLKDESDPHMQWVRSLLDEYEARK